MKAGPVWVKGRIYMYTESSMWKRNKALSTLAFATPGHILIGWKRHSAFAFSPVMEYKLGGYHNICADTLQMGPIMLRTEDWGMGK